MIIIIREQRSRNNNKGAEVPVREHGPPRAAPEGEIIAITIQIQIMIIIIIRCMCIYLYIYIYIYIYYYY